MAFVLTITVHSAINNLNYSSLLSRYCKYSFNAKLVTQIFLITMYRELLNCHSSAHKSLLN